MNNMEIPAQQAMQEMNEILSQFLWSHLQSLGLFREKHVVLTGLREQAGISTGYNRWLQESIALLERQQYLHCHDTTLADGRAICTVVDPTLIESAALWQRWDQLKEGWMCHADLKAQVILVETTLCTLPAILTGQRPATEVLFPNGSMQLVEGIYQHNATADYFNDVLATLLMIYLQERLTVEKHARIRILEIGAGTGGTTSRVLPMLQPYQAAVAEYCYSDISKSFLQYGQRMYGAEHSYLTYQLLNIEKSLAEQGIEAGSYDVVIATNVLHATSNIQRTVRNTKAALKKHGLLLLNEITGANLFAHLTFGLLEGWWAYEDPELRVPGCPALTAENWEAVLNSEGFRAISFPTQDTQEAGQQVIVAESDGVVRQARKQSDTNTRTSQSAVQAQAESRRSVAASNRKESDSHFITDQMVKDHVRSIILESIAEVLKVHEGMIQEERNFPEYGVDSIVALKLINVINQKGNLTLRVTALFEYNSIEQLLQYILRDHTATLRATLQESVLARGSGVEGIQTIRSESTRRARHRVGTRHDPYSNQNIEYLTQNIRHKRQWRRFQTPLPHHEPIAIIGMSGRFARSKTVNELWEHLANGTDLIEEVSRWDHAELDPVSAERRIPYCKHGSFLDGIDLFDSLFFNISGFEATYMDPQQRLVLEEGWKALEDAGYVGESIEGQRCGVYIGCVAGDYQLLFDGLPPAQAFWGNVDSVVPARIAYYLNLRGPAIAIDTACSSSLVAMHLACQGLWSGEMDIALAGGVYVQCTPQFYQRASSAGMLSATGHCSTFDNRADGFVPGEGVGMVVLKRLKDALASGDHIYGMIRGSGINQDGATTGITVPSANAQEQLERSVYETFQIEPSQIQMVEAHGTGTKLGDPIEYEALTRAFRKYTDHCQYCAIGSIKTNIGHTIATAGVAGVIKILLALQHRQIPPSLHFQSGNEHIQFKESPFYVNTRLKDWEIEGEEIQRRAAVSSFGFSGTNAHMVIEEAPEHLRRHAQRPGYLIVLSARTADQLRQQVEQLAAFCESSTKLDCGNISYTLLLGRKHFKHRLACIVRSHQELGALLRNWLVKGKVPQISVSNLENRGQGENVSLRDYGNQCIENCQHWTASAPDIYLEKLSTVADLYLQGYRLAFEQLFAGGEYSRISLPTYPFAREHYWIPISKGTQATTVLSALHPLVQRNTSTLWEQRFSSTFRGDEFFLADHVIMGQRIMPGVVYLEMARAAIAAAWGRGRVPQVQATGADAPSLPNCLRLSRVVWARPLVVSAHPVTVHIALEAQESGTVTFLISEDGQGQEDGGLRTTDHLWRIGSAQGTIPTAPVRSVPLLLSRGTAELYEESASGLIANQSLDLPAVQARCQHQIPVTEWYERSRSLGISYGPALQGIEQMSVGEDEVLARLRLPVTPGVSPGVAQTYAGGGGIGASHGIGIGAKHDHRRKPDGYGPRLLPYVLHPSMLDAALQSCFALSMLGSSEHQDPHLPFELEEISIMGEVPAQGWAWGRQRPRSTAGSVFDIEVCDDEGRIVVRLRGLSSRTLQEAPALPTEQEARVCNSEAPDIRRDSSYESQQYKAQRLQHLSAPSLQAPFPRNDGEITDQMVRDHVQLILLESMAEVLQIDERNIEEDISFSEYGVDSIVAVNLINVINQKSHLSLQVTVLFDNNDIEQLVQHILREEMTTLKALLQDGRLGHSSVRRPEQALPLQDETAPGAQERLIDVGQGTSQRGLVGARMGASPTPTAPTLSVPTATVRDTGADADRAERNVPITSLRTGVVGTRTGTSPVPTNGATQTTKGIDDLATHHEPIAIIGMSGCFAHSKTVSELWEHLANGTDLVEEVSRWDLAELSPASGEKTEPYCKHGSFLEEIDLFDPLFFNISRHEAAYMDPQQRLVLEEAWKALEDAGYAGSSIEGRRCGVYIGCISGDYPRLFNDVPPAQAFWGNASSVIPARIAYYLNLQGPAIAIDAACSSSLVAIHLACQSLWNGETEMALAGGVFLQCTPQFYQSANRAGMLSQTGHCFTFDDRADGFVPGEGVGIVVLKRLKDAVASGDHIYGVIRGSGINQDGTTRGITVPSTNSQERLLCSVYETFQIDPAQIQMVEAHGTGTKLGDPIEYEALTRSFQKYTDKKEYCALGSIKTNLGHTATAAGVAGIIKILLSLQHRQIPASLHFQSGNAHIQFEGSPFYVNTSLQDWRVAPAGDEDGTRRCAAISSFGFSGTNAHMVIEEAPEYSRRHAEMPSYLIVLSARTSDQLRQQVEQLVAFCACPAEVDCGNMSYTLLLGRKHLKHRLACVVRNHKELEALLRKWLEKGKVPQISVANLENWELRETPSLKRYGNQCIEDCRSTTQTETYLEQLSTVADLYLQGYTLAFEQLFEGKGYTRISLPTYPFARERCWANEIDTLPNQRDKLIGHNLGSQERIHPSQTSIPVTTQTLLLTPVWKEEAILHASQEAPFLPQQMILLCELPSIEASRIQARLAEGGRCRSLLSSQPLRGERFQEAVVELIQELQHLIQSEPVRAILMQVVVAQKEKPSFLEALAGILKTAQQEYPRLRGQLIEVEEEPEEEELLARLRENLYRPHDLHIRYRDGKRWVTQWQEIGEDKPHPYVSASVNIPWKEGRCYLITGGAGGLARIFVQEMTRRVQEATVILVGRSALSVEQRAQLEQTENPGICIDYQQVDVSNRSAVHTLVQRVLWQYGHLDGIIHASGVLHNTPLLNKTREQVLAVLASKVIGAELLDEASAQIPLDFFVLCSSLTAVVGQAGHADYAGANAYLDAFAHARRAQVMAGERQGETISINWPFWKEGGMQMDVSTIQMLRELLGEEPMDTETGIKMFYQALACGQAQVIVLHGQVERIKRRLLQRPQFPMRTVPGSADPDHQVQIDMLGEHLKRMVSRLLKVRVEEIDTKTELSDYGFDSITFTKLADLLNQTYQLDLSPALFYEYSTLERLTQYMQVNYASILASHFAVSPVAPRPAPRVRKDSVPEQVTTEEASSAAILTESRLSDFRTLIQISEPTALAALSSIAIIGMSGMFPQAPDMQSFWSNLLEGRDCISEIPPSRWDWQTYFGNPATEANKTNVKWAGILEGTELFDPLFFGISPREAEQMDPQQRLLMLSVWKAIEDAGYSATSLSGTNTALFVGMTSNGYGERLFRANVEVEGYSSTGLTPSMGPNRMSYFLNLHGPSEAIDTACSSSLVAIHRGINAIESGQCDTAIVGGVNTLVSPEAHVSASKAGMLCEDGRCKTFSAQANGYVRSEGVGMLVLKKLDLAEQAGDHIYAVIRGSAENHGGHASSLTAPNPRAQTDLLIAAYRKAGIDPRTVGYIEAHGTGTALGDPIEINALKAAFSELAPRPIEVGLMREATCGIGSVKSNIGHLELASGVTGLIKVLLQLQHKKLVKSLHCEQLNPYIQLEGSPFYIVQENREWETLRDHEGHALPRRAGVSSFGFGGANAHIVLEEYVPKPRAMSSGREQASAFIVLSAKNEERLREQVQQLLTWVQAESGDKEPLEQAQMLQDLAYTLQVGREAMEGRLALQVSSLADLTEKLSRFLQDPQEGGDWYRGQVKRNDTIGIFAADEDGQKAIAAWMSKEKYGKLLELWVKGGTVDWKLLYTVGTGQAQGPLPTVSTLPRRISLPTYPFARERYWIPAATSELTAGSIGATVSLWSKTTDNPTLHPLVQRNTSTLWGQRFSSTFRGDEFFLSDHVISGQHIMPGVAYLEMARAAVREAIGPHASHESRQLRLKHIVWVRPLVVGEQSITVHIALEVQDNRTIAFFISREKVEEETLEQSIVCQGIAELHAESTVPSLDLASVQARCQDRTLLASECYQNYRELGISYGPALQGIEQLSVGEDEVLARLREPLVVAQTRTEGDRRDGACPHPYVLHPSLLDSALQASIGFLIERPEHQKPHLPFELSELAIEGPMPTQGWAWVRRRPVGTGIAPVPTMVLDIEVCDDAGRIAVRLHGLSARQLSAHSNGTRTVLLTPSWKEETISPLSLSQEAHLPTQQEARPSATVVLLCGLPNIEVSHFQAQMAPGEHCRSLPVGTWTGAEGTSQRGQALSLRSPVHVPSIPPVRQLHREQRFQDVVLQLIQELQHLLQSRSAGSVLVQVVVAHREEQPLLEALSGVLKTARQEYPQLIGQLIEVEGEPEEEELLDYLRENQLQMAYEPHIRYSCGKRWVREWQEQPLVSTLPKMPWKEGGCYLITGGAGGLARLFVQEIAQQVKAATIILVGRSALSATQRAQLDAVACMRGSSGSIHIDYQQVDVSDGPAMHALIQRVLTMSGHLDGIIHAAGVLHDSLLLNKTPEEVQAVLAPKVIGVEHLDGASSNIPLDFFILCSSLAAVTGNVGQADYAAANAYLDAFAHARAAQVLAGERQGATVSINWPLWDEGGMHIEAEKIQMMREWSGIEVMDTKTGMKVLYQALASEQAQVIVLHGEVERIKLRLLSQSLGPAESITSELDRQLSWTTDNEEQAVASMREEEGLLREKASAYLKKQLADVIKVPVSQIDASAPLENYGFNSIMAIRWTSVLERSFGPLSKTLLFEYPTFQSVTEYFLHSYPAQLRKVLRIEESGGASHASMTSLQVTEEQIGGPDQIASLQTHNQRLALLQTGAGGTGQAGVHVPTTAQQDKEVARGWGQAPTLQAPQGDIAIIGVAGRYPQARDLRAFWENLRNGRDCITEIPPERWDYRLYFDPNKNKPGTTYSKWGGFLEGVDEFDPLFFNISPREAERMDPQERLFLECAYATLEDAGNTRAIDDPRSYGMPKSYNRSTTNSGMSQSHRSAGNVGVFVGVMYEEYQLFGAEAQVQGQPIALAGSPSSIANRVSYFCNFHGPSIAVDTMCSSSLTAIHLACQSIKQGECEMAIAGGVNVSIHPNKYLGLAQGQFVSSQGHCESFGQGADGYVPSEGVGAVLLKPLAQAEADGDHIYGLIRATAVNHGGKTNGYTVPNPLAQAEVIGRALSNAGIDPRTISYIEAHGTGTTLGDPIEIAGLVRAFQQGMQNYGDPARMPEESHTPVVQDTGSAQGTSQKEPALSAPTAGWCAIGSVKSNIGHAESAAGIAGVTKVLLQMRYGQLVPSLHAEALNPHIDFSTTPFVVQQELSEWKRPLEPRADGKKEVPRRAGISSFGAGGSNAHVIIEEYIHRSGAVGTSQRGQALSLRATVRVQKDPGDQALPDEAIARTSSRSVLIVLSARTQEQLRERVQQLLTWIQQREHAQNLVEQAQGQDATRSLLDNLAYTLQVGREAMEERLALQVDSLAELSEKLGRYVGASMHEDGDWYEGQVKRNDPIGAFAADEDGQRTVAAWMSKGKYEKLLTWWVKGLAVDWKLLYTVGARSAQGTSQRGLVGVELAPTLSVPTAPALPRLISLPTYPFARERYWVPTPKAGLMTPSSPPPSPIATVHPRSSEASPFPIAQHPDAIPSPQPEAGTSLIAPNKVALRPLADQPLPSTITRRDSGLPLSACTLWEIPQTNMQMALSVGIGQSTDPKLAPQLEEELARSLAEVLYMEQNAIDVEKPFGEIGLDSVIGVEWIQSLNKQYASNLKASCVYDYPTIRQLAGFLQKELLKQNTRIQQTSVETMSTLSLDDILQKVQQGTLDIKTADQVLHQLYLSIGLSPDSYTQAKKERQ